MRALTPASKQTNTTISTIHVFHDLEMSWSWKYPNSWSCPPGQSCLYGLCTPANSHPHRQPQWVLWIVGASNSFTVQRFVTAGASQSCDINRPSISHKWSLTSQLNRHLTAAPLWYFGSSAGTGQNVTVPPTNMAVECGYSRYRGLDTWMRILGGYLDATSRRETRKI